MSIEARLDAAERTLEFIAKWAWRTDPPNATNRLTDEERFEAIKWHPTIQLLGAPHRELAKNEASNAE
ncbi:hypothetical protein [Brucella anthropi]|uniref:hypothetical protein n=1 Tax=Brucella anthropi TaxID=529 RepID=UPI000F65BD9D|nr:hypothetical protein [Brucella anthropi]RRY11356.1 hypothetical protein EGJ58_06745 [Brucella anthropi]